MVVVRSVVTSVVMDDGSEADPPQGGVDVGDGDGDDATSPTGTSYVRGVRRLRMTYSPGFLGCGLT